MFSRRCCRCHTPCRCRLAVVVVAGVVASSLCLCSQAVGVVVAVATLSLVAVAFVIALHGLSHCIDPVLRVVAWRSGSRLASYLAASGRHSTKCASRLPSGPSARKEIAWRQVRIWERPRRQEGGGRGGSASRVECLQKCERRAHLPAAHGAKITLSHAPQQREDRLQARLWRRQKGAWALE
ncbi:hypothetical protein EDB89DRAFT_1965042 [Lactarius sanguifluus]|nr:hypothetical protein EDB89DRAFT_1969917 [Lactarius sanguifluus]KAH9172270.1 hypothetical protein EDB89DRAFT_1966270 [Lactarius sanguifluus]KAH9172582.1 hypothetical protein EDB89DRAFT_1965042 [Lactarius sanguifluus]